jgi:hemerythrin
VKNEELDEEHDECASALDQLVEQRSASSLRSFLDLFERHCAHEEALLNHHLYSPEEKRLAVEGGISLLLNSRTSHFKDHEKLIKRAKQELTTLDREGSAVVPASYVDSLLRDFENHANVYDASYADRLAEALEVYI